MENFRYLRVIKWSKSIFDFYINSSIHVALAVVCLANVSATVSSNSLPSSLLIFIFCSALFAYNFIKFFPFIMNNKTNKLSRFILIITLLCFLVSIFLFFKLKLLTQIFVLIGGILVFLYSTPFKQEKDNLRNIKGWKVYLVVITWVLLTVGVPFSMTPAFSLNLFFNLLIIEGIYIFVSILPFEIRDLAIDAPGLHTFPQRLGIFKTKILGSILLFIILIYTFLKFGFHSPFSLSTGLCLIILTILLNRSSSKRSKYFSSFWVESIPVFWAVSFHLFTYI